VEALGGFLDTYGLAAACAVILTKAIGVPIPIPGDVILIGTAARAAEGKVLVWLAFAGLLVALTVGGTLQFLLARGPARGMVIRYGRRLGLTTQRLDAIAERVHRAGALGIGLAVLTPGVRTAVIPACGLSNVPMRLFLPGLALGSGLDLGLHFAIGYAGAGLLRTLVEASPGLIVAGLAVVGLGIWLLLARRRRTSSLLAVHAWAQATCPVCLVVGERAINL
jgi:membrane protein DedA with SNARE-associated domain